MKILGIDIYLGIEDDSGDKVKIEIEVSKVIGKPVILFETFDYGDDGDELYLKFIDESNEEWWLDVNANQIENQNKKEIIKI